MQMFLTIFTILRCLHSTSQFVHTDYITSFLKFYADGELYYQSRPVNRRIPLPEYDFIIVGAGSAGCVLADRLTENPEWKVLLLEAGALETYYNYIPLSAHWLQHSSINWKYKTEPSDTSCLGLKNNQSNWAAGKTVGGTSALNYMINTRGNRKDYNDWEAMGNPGWGYEHVLKYFKKLEKMTIPEYQNDSLYHGYDGPIPVSYAAYRTGISKAIIEAAKTMGHPILDYNGANQIGYSYLQLHLNNGTRASSGKSYLNPISSRKNLHVKADTFVDKVLIDPTTKRAYGIEYRYEKNIYRIRASKEVIISAGAISSPKLLMLSGIGPRNHLRQLNISVKANLKVGFNLMDHVTVGGLTFLIDKPYSFNFNKIFYNSSTSTEYFTKRDGPATMAGGAEVVAFYDLKNPNEINGHPDLELLFLGGSLASDVLLSKGFGIRDDIYNTVYKPLEDKECFMVWPILLQPKSRGRVLLRDANPDSKPLLYHNYFDDEDDLKVITDGVDKILELMNQPALQNIGARVHDIPIPGCTHLPFGSRQYWECHTRHLTLTLWHFSGTAKMGPKSDKTAVVDPRLRVFGIHGLRVIDASIMPAVPAAHTNTPTYMVAEKGADMIKEDWNWP